MNIQTRIPLTRWTFHWIAWQAGEPYFCIGVHLYPKGPLWNWYQEPGMVFGWSPVDSFMLHLGPLAFLFTRK